MTELLPLSIGIGLAAGILFTELFGVATGGLIVPGYMALYLTDPVPIAVTLGAAFATFAGVRALSTFLIIYGRRRTALMLLAGYLCGMLLNSWGNVQMEAFAVIGFVIPGLIAIWMDRQGVIQTICSMFIVSSVVRLLLIVLAGPDVLP